MTRHTDGIAGDAMKLTATEVYEIRRFYNEGWTRKRGNSAAIARAYGIAQNYVYAIGKRLVWMELSEDVDSQWAPRQVHLAPARVQQIRRFYDQGMHLRQRGMATAFARYIGASTTTLRRIARRDIYRSVPEEDR